MHNVYSSLIHWQENRWRNCSTSMWWAIAQQWKEWSSYACKMCVKPLNYAEERSKIQKSIYCKILFIRRFRSGNTELWWLKKSHTVTALTGSWWKMSPWNKQKQKDSIPCLMWLALQVNAFQTQIVHLVSEHFTLNFTLKITKAKAIIR